MVHLLAVNRVDAIADAAPFDASQRVFGKKPVDLSSPKNNTLQKANATTTTATTATTATTTTTTKDNKNKRQQQQQQKTTTKDNNSNSNDNNNNNNNSSSSNNNNNNRTSKVCGHVSTSQHDSGVAYLYGECVVDSVAQCTTQW